MKLRKKTLFYFFTIGAGILLSLSLTFWQLFRNFERITYESMSEINQDFASQTDALTEIMNASMTDYVMQLFYSAPIQTLRSKNPISSTDSSYILRDLDSILKTSGFLESIVVHNGYTDTVYSAGTDNFIQPLKDYDVPALQRLIVNKAEESVLIPIYCRSTDPEKDGYYAIVYYTRRESSGSPSPSTLILTINASWYQRNISLFSNDNDNIVVFNEDGEVIMASDMELKKLCASYYRDTILEKAGSNGYFTSPDNQILMFHKSADTGYTYMRVTQLKDAMPQLYQMQKITFTVMSALIILFIAIFIFLAFITWSPLKKMHSTLNAIGNILDNKSVSEPEMPHPLLPTTQQIESVVVKAERVRLEYLFYDMLMKKISPDSKTLFSSSTNMWGLLLASAGHRTDIYRAASDHFPTILVCKTRSSYACITPVSSEEDYQQLQHLFHEKITAQPLILSSLIEQFDSLADHFERLSELQKLTMIIPHDGWRISETLLDNMITSNPFGSRDFSDFAVKLRSGNITASQEKWQELLKKISQCRYESFQQAMLKLSEFMQNSFMECGMTETPTCQKFPIATEQLEHIDQLNTIMDESITQICHYYDQKKTVKYSQQAEEIRKLIETSYHDNNLSSQTIADMLQMNNAYLGRMFRASCGYSINDYINLCRLNESKRLLLSSTLSIEEVAQAAGFYNLKYFYVLFKKQLGVTPAAFRTTELQMLASATSPSADSTHNVSPAPESPPPAPR